MGLLDIYRYVYRLLNCLPASLCNTTERTTDAAADFLVLAPIRLIRNLW